MPQNEAYTDKDKKWLLRLARQTIENALKGDELPYPVDVPKVWQAKRGVFVTLTEGGELRGCIGYIEPIKAVWRAVIDNAYAAAFNDPRFWPLSKEELPRVKIEISILSLPKLVDKQGEELLAFLKPGKHGVILERGLYRATFLPQVWEQLPSKEDFLAQLCLKAGMEPTCWKDPSTNVYVYEVDSFEETA